MYYGASNSCNSCVFDVIYELVWWYIQNDHLSKEDFTETYLFRMLKEDQHLHTESSNLVRNIFRDRFVGKYWTQYRELMNYIATIETHCKGTARFGV